MEGFKRSFCLFLAILFTSTQTGLSAVAESTFWEDRRRSIAEQRTDPLQLANLIPAAHPPLSPVSTSGPNGVALSDVLQQKIPADLLLTHRPLFDVLAAAPGTVREVVSPGGAQGPLVLHFQDVHQNGEAQRHMAETLLSLGKAHLLHRVALEGAFGPVDLERFRSFPRREVTARVADYLLKRNEITGPIHAALTSPTVFPTVVGVDDPDLYAANVKAYRTSAPRLEEVRRSLAVEGAALEKAKAAVYSPALRRLDGVVASYRAGRTELGSYVDALFKWAPAKTRDLRLFAQALELERGLDFGAVERERRELLEHLSSRLSGKELQALLALGWAHRSGRVGADVFYQRLVSLCASKGGALKDRPALKKYVDYVILTEGIHSDRLFEDLQELERAAYDGLARRTEERALVQRSRRWNLAKKLVDFELTPGEWREYIAVGKKEDFPDLRSFEGFYRMAQARDEVMAKNLMASLGKDPAGVTVLVTGGYHTAGLKEKLTRAGCRWATFVPTIEKWDSPRGAEALSVFSQRKAPLDRLFSGQKLFLTQNPLKGISAAAVLIPGLSSDVQAQIHQFLQQVAPELAATTRIEHWNEGPQRIRLRVTRVGKDPVDITVQRNAQGAIDSVEPQGVHPRFKKWNLWAARWERLSSFLPNKIRWAGYWEWPFLRFLPEWGWPFLVWFLTRHRFLSLDSLLVRLVGLLAQWEVQKPIPRQFGCVLRAAWRGIQAHGAFNRHFPWAPLQMDRGGSGNETYMFSPLRKPDELAPWQNTPEIRVRFSQGFLHDGIDDEGNVQRVSNMLAAVGRDLAALADAAFDQKYRLKKSDGKGFYRVKSGDFRLYFTFHRLMGEITLIGFFAKHTTTKNEVTDPHFFSNLKGRIDLLVEDKELVESWGKRLALIQEQDRAVWKHLLVETEALHQLINTFYAVVRSPANPLLWNDLKTRLQSELFQNLFLKLVVLHDETKGDPKDLLLRLSAGWNLSEEEWRALADFVESWEFWWQDLLVEISTSPLEGVHVQTLQALIPSAVFAHALQKGFDRWARSFLNDFADDPEVALEAVAEVRAAYEKLLALDAEIHQNPELEKRLGEMEQAASSVPEAIPLSVDIPGFDLTESKGWVYLHRERRTGDVGTEDDLSARIRSLVPTPGVTSVRVQETRQQSVFDWDLLLLPVPSVQENPWALGRSLAQKLLEQATSAQRLRAGWSLESWIDMKTKKELTDQEKTQLEKMTTGLAGLSRKTVFVPVGPTGALPAALAALCHRLGLPYDVVAVESPNGKLDFKAAVLSPEKRRSRELKENARLFQRFGRGVVRVPSDVLDSCKTFLSDRHYTGAGPSAYVLGPIFNREVREAFQARREAVFVVDGLAEKAKENPVPREDERPASVPIAPVVGPAGPIAVDLHQSLFDQLAMFLNDLLKKNNVPGEVSATWAKNQFYAFTQEPEKRAQNKKAAWGKVELKHLGLNAEHENVLFPVLYDAVHDFVAQTKIQLWDLMGSRKVFRSRESLDVRFERKTQLRKLLQTFPAAGLLSIQDMVIFLKTWGDVRPETLVAFINDHYILSSRKILLGLVDSRGIARPFYAPARNFPDPLGETAALDPWDPDSIRDATMVFAADTSPKLGTPQALMFGPMTVEARPAASRDSSLSVALIPKSVLMGYDERTERRHLEDLVQRLDLRRDTSVFSIGHLEVFSLVPLGVGVHALIEPEDVATVTKWQKNGAGVKMGEGHLNLQPIFQPSDVASYSEIGRFDRVLVNQKKYLPHMIDLIAPQGRIELSGEAAWIDPAEMDAFIALLQLKGLTVKNLTFHEKEDGTPLAWVVHLGGEDQRVREWALRRQQVEGGIDWTVDFHQSLYDQLAEALNGVLRAQGRRPVVDAELAKTVLREFSRAPHWETSFQQKALWSEAVFKSLGDDPETSQEVFLDLYTVTAAFVRQLQNQVGSILRNTQLPERLREDNRIEGEPLGFFSVRDVLTRLGRLSSQERDSVFLRVFQPQIPYYVQEDKSTVFIVGAVDGSGHFRPLHAPSGSFRDPEGAASPIDFTDKASLRGVLMVTVPGDSHRFPNPSFVAFENLFIETAFVQGDRRPALPEGRYLDVVVREKNRGREDTLKAGEMLADLLEMKPGHMLLSLGHHLSVVLTAMGARVLFVSNPTEVKTIEDWAKDQKSILTAKGGVFNAMAYEEDEDRSELTHFGPYDRVLVTRVKDLPLVPKLIQHNSILFIAGEAAGHKDKVAELLAVLRQAGYSIDENKIEEQHYSVIKLTGKVAVSTGSLQTLAAFFVSALVGIALSFSLVPEALAGTMAVPEWRSWPMGLGGMIFGGAVVFRVLKTIGARWPFLGKDRSTAAQARREALAFQQILRWSPARLLSEQLTERPAPLLSRFDPRTSVKAAGNPHRRSDLLDRVERHLSDPVYAAVFYRTLSHSPVRDWSGSALFAALAAWRSGRTLAAPPTAVFHLHFAWEENVQLWEPLIRRWVSNSSSGGEGAPPLRLGLVASSIEKKDVLKALVSRLGASGSVTVFETPLGPDSTDGTTFFKEYQRQCAGENISVTVSYGNGRGFDAPGPLRGIPEGSPLAQALLAPLRWVLDDVIGVLELSRKIAQYA